MGDVQDVTTLERLAVVPFTCPCGKFYHVADDSQGHQVRCPFCYELRDVPAPPKPAPRSPWRVRKPRFFSWPGRLLFVVMLAIPIGGPAIVWFVTTPSRSRAAASPTQIVHQEKSWEENQGEPHRKIDQKVGIAHSVSPEQPRPNAVSFAGPRPRVPAGPMTPEQQALLNWLVKYADDPASVEVVEWRQSPRIDGPTSYPGSDYAIDVWIRENGPFGYPHVHEKLVYLKSLKVIGYLSPSNYDQGLFNHEMGVIFRDRDPDPLGTAWRAALKSPAHGRRP